MALGQQWWLWGGGNGQLLVVVMTVQRNGGSGAGAAAACFEQLNQELRGLLVPCKWAQLLSEDRPCIHLELRESDADTSCCIPSFKTALDRRRAPVEWEERWMDVERAELGQVEKTLRQENAIRCSHTQVWFDGSERGQKVVLFCSLRREER